MSMQAYSSLFQPVQAYFSLIQPIPCNFMHFIGTFNFFPSFTVYICTVYFYTVYFFKSSFLLSHIRETLNLAVCADNAKHRCKTVENSQKLWKWLTMFGNNLTMVGNGWKWLETVENGWTRLQMHGNGWKWFIQKLKTVDNAQKRWWWPIPAYSSLSQVFQPIPDG